MNIPSAVAFSIILTLTLSLLFVLLTVGNLNANAPTIMWALVVLVVVLGVGLVDRAVGACEARDESEETPKKEPKS